MPVLPRADRVRYEEAAADLRRHYQTTGIRDLTRPKAGLKHLDPFFAARRLASIGQADAARYAEQRQGEGPRTRPSTASSPCWVGCAKIAYEGSKLFRLPVLRKLKEGRPAARVLRAGPIPRRPARSSPRILSPSRSSTPTGGAVRARSSRSAPALDLEAGTLASTPGRPPRMTMAASCTSPPELVALSQAQLERVRALERRLGRIVPSVFPTGARVAAPGSRRRDFRKVWATACTRRRAGAAPARLPADRGPEHGQRRGAERVAMKVTGPQDARRVRPVPHREPGRPPGRGARGWRARIRAKSRRGLG